MSKNLSKHRVPEQFLSNEEIEQITGKVRSSAQTRALEEMAIEIVTFKKTRTGSKFPLVSRDYFDNVYCKQNLYDDYEDAYMKDSKEVPTDVK